MEASKNKTDVDWSLFNVSQHEWIRIELPHGLVAKNPEVYLLIAILIMLISIPLNCFLAVHILRQVKENLLRTSNFGTSYP